VDKNVTNSPDHNGFRFIDVPAIDVPHYMIVACDERSSSARRTVRLSGIAFHQQCSSFRADA
jgi:hypothetical protein